MVGAELVYEQLLLPGGEVGDFFVVGDCGEGVVGDFPAEPEGTFYGDT